MNSLNPTYAQPNALLRRRPRDLTDEQKAEVREAFEIFDMDKDGALDFHEFKVSPPKVLNVLKKMTRTIPIASNLLNSTSLVSSHRPFIDNLVTEKILSRDPLEEVRKAFKLFDEDGTGRISLRNLRHIALELGENIDDDELRAMIDEFDLDGDGEINEQEFIAIMTEAGL